SCPGDDLGIIIKVELRLYGYGDGNDRIDVTPIFAATNVGTTHQTTPVVAPGDWTAYVDITNDPNHPDWSLWSHIQTLDCKIAFAKVGKANTVYCAKVEIRVHYWSPPVSEIDVGAAPIDRSSLMPHGYTRVDRNNPANASGTLHTVKVFAEINMSNVIVGTFYRPDPIDYPNKLKCRDSEVIGHVPAGSEQTFTGLSILIQQDDYIGVYYPYGNIEATCPGYLGVWWIYGEHIDPGDEATYDLNATRAMSLYGYGDIEAPPEPWTG
ncbi:unnamed protein product, partial [marine sediment metagenome]